MVQIFTIPKAEEVSLEQYVIQINSSTTDIEIREIVCQAIQGLTEDLIINLATKTQYQNIVIDVIMASEHVPEPTKLTILDRINFDPILSTTACETHLDNEVFLCTVFLNAWNYMPKKGTKILQNIKEKIKIQTKKSIMAITNYDPKIMRILR